MKSIFEAISAQTPKIFAKMAAFSVALGVVSVAIFEAPEAIKDVLPAEVFQGAKYFALMSWALNLFSIAQKEYQEESDEQEGGKENESTTPNRP